MLAIGSAFGWELLRRENAGLSARLMSAEAELNELRTGTAENAPLRAQLKNVGLELAEARQRLAEMERRQGGEMDPVVSRYRDRQALVLLPLLMTLLPENDRFLIVDGGAREVDRDPRWRPFPPERLRFIGFEPDEAEAQRLNATPGPGGLEWKFVPAGLWGSSGQMQFEHNKASGGSSFLPQNRAVTDRWKFENPREISHARDIFFPVSYQDMRVVSLADWAQDAKVDTIDFLKLNVQGGELQILEGAGNLLDSVLGLLVEISFAESYKDRPLFSDVDRFLTRRKFVFFDLLAHHYVGRSAAPIAAQHLLIAQPKLGQLVSSWGQLVEGHALYMRDPLADESGKRLDPMRVIKLAAFAEAYGQIEYAFELLDWVATRADVAGTPLSAKLRDIIGDAANQYQGLSSLSATTSANLQTTAPADKIK